MKKQFFSIAALLFWMLGFAQSDGSISVTIEEIKKPGEGQLVFMLFDQEDGFPKEPTKAKYLGILSDFKSKATYVFEGIPKGVYAIAAFHDKDMNKEIETNFMGMPKEPVGAANMKGMGRPSFSKSKIRFDGTSESITLNFIND